MSAKLIDILSRRWSGIGFVISGDDYETLRRSDGGEVPSLGAIEAHRGDVESEMATADERQRNRAALRTQWDGLPAYIRGPYRPLFDSANRLLDEGDDTAAAEMIRLAEPMPGHSGSERATFDAVKAQFYNAINNLPR